jgi:uncharacterized protein
MNIALERPNADYFIKSYQPGKLSLNHGEYQHSIVVYQDQLISDWQVNTINDLTADHIEQLVSMGPKIILLGTGKTHEFPDAAILAHAYQHGIGVEIMQTDAACRTYNILASEGRDVLAALMI